MDAASRKARATGVDVINLSIGSPDRAPAPHIIEALSRAVRDQGNYGYPMACIPRYNEAVAAWYQRRFDVTLDPPTEVLGIAGSQDGLAHLCLATTNPGDIVLVPDPGYPVYSAGPVMAGAVLYPVALSEAGGYLPDFDAIPEDIWRRAKVMLLNYPSNPLAATADLDFFRRVVEVARRRHVVVVHDAAYCELTFDGYRPPSFLQVEGAKEVGIEFNSLSKTFNMAGCRIGYAVGNPEIIKALAEVKGHLDFGIFRPVQEAGIAALEGPQEWVRDNAAAYQRRRDILVDGLAAAGWKMPKPKATMFCWAPIPSAAGIEGDSADDTGCNGPDSRGACANSMQFALRLLEKTGIVIVPGIGFGERGEGYARLALVQSEERMAEAVRRFAASGMIG